METCGSSQVIRRERPGSSGGGLTPWEALNPLHLTAGSTSTNVLSHLSYTPSTLHPGKMHFLPHNRVIEYWTELFPTSLPLYLPSVLPLSSFTLLLSTDRNRELRLFSLFVVICGLDGGAGKVGISSPSPRWWVSDLLVEVRCVFSAVGFASLSYLTSQHPPSDIPPPILVHRRKLWSPPVWCLHGSLY